MPKTSSPARPSRAYNALFRKSLQQSQIDAIYAFRSRFLCDGVVNKDIGDEDQNALWLTEAILRTHGLSSTERPQVDKLETRGRTIYDTDLIDFDTPTPSPQARRVLVRRLSEVTRSQEKLGPETAICPIKNIAEPITPPRKGGARPCASSPSPSSDTLFLTLTKKSNKRFVTSPSASRKQKAELMSGSYASIPDTPESCRSVESTDTRAWSRSPTPPLSWSVESSPESVRSMEWDEDWPAIEPLNYDGSNKDGGKTAEAALVEDSYQKLFEMFVNAGDEMVMSF